MTTIGHNRRQLVQYCKDHGIKKYSRKRNHELIELIGQFKKTLTSKKGFYIPSRPWKIIIQFTHGMRPKKNIRSNWQYFMEFRDILFEMLADNLTTDFVSEKSDLTMIYNEYNIIDNTRIIDILHRHKISKKVHKIKPTQKKFFWCKRRNKLTSSSIVEWDRRVPTPTDYYIRRWNKMLILKKAANPTEQMKNLLGSYFNNINKSINGAVYLNFEKRIYKCKIIKIFPFQNKIKFQIEQNIFKKNITSLDYESIIAIFIDTLKNSH
jgi:hypothetical protein